MSDIILSSSVRQNLLSLQSTADLLSTTQNRLATGKKVNTALDNPTNFFTAQSLDNRASDINNLLDGIGNGVQVLQAANTGITSLQKLVDTAKSIANQVLQSPTGYTTRSSVTSTAALGGTAANLVDGTTIKSGDVLAIAASAGQPAFSFTFGANSSLAQLNTALSASNLTASLDSSNKLVITTTNDAASSTIGAVTFTNTGGGTATFSAAGTAPVADSASQSARAALVQQYNNTISQITTTAQDSSFNGINLLSGDSLKLTFNETGKSTLSITGVKFDAAGLGLKSLTAGTDFLDNNSANGVIASLSSASSSLRSEASTLGSNLSIVQIRQDFSKNLINVLQTGSSNLTLADTNEEAANSQALSTRQSIAVSALALANQSQQSVLQLLR
ncbi:flagellin-like hook-associated protein FlgL [Bradyrhizobium macuxiense]|uniref:Flagellin n=1 Tax=Bradyrhizobium macuxiense TaxID=1755647 RepID=A0A560LNJ0_9BRAD|nr:flagellin [Bradyrhizobium macuxiense]TWB97071.1 flagellin-like hook-associated protein FlgL [Bradyrhizobium macuxiense]